MRILIAPGPRPGDGRQVVRVVLFGERGVEAIAADERPRPVRLGDAAGRRQASRPRPPHAADAEDEEEEDEGGTGARLYESLYETALKNDLPRQTVEELVRIFGFDVDFQRRVSAGDTFEVFYGQDEDSSAPEVLYAALTVGGETPPRLPLPGRGRRDRLLRRARAAR